MKFLSSPHSRRQPASGPTPLRVSTPNAMRSFSRTLGRCAQIREVLEEREDMDRIHTHINVYFYFDVYVYTFPLPFSVF